jgi:hypothetical protein
MRRAVDGAIALDEDVGRIRRGAGAPVADLEALARRPRMAPAFDEVPSPWMPPVCDAAILAAMGIVNA